jgi:large subunit ribosomal protein L7/L12
MQINIYNLISAVFCGLVGIMALSRGLRGNGWLFYCWAVGLWMMAAGVLVRIWQLQAAAGFVMVASVVVDERIAARHYATHRMNLQDEPAKAVRAVPAGPEDEPVSFEIILKSAGDRREDVIAALRDIYVLDSKDADKLTKGVNRPIKQFMSKQEAEYVNGKLEACGAKVEVRPM